MSWQEGVAVAVVLLGLGAGALLVARRPSFWIEFGSRLAGALLPLLSPAALSARTAASAAVAPACSSLGGVLREPRCVLPEAPLDPSAHDDGVNSVSSSTSSVTGSVDVCKSIWEVTCPWVLPSRCSVLLKGATVVLSSVPVTRT